MSFGYKDEPSRFKFHWIGINTNNYPNAVLSADGKMATIAPGTLSAGSSYTFQLEVWTLTPGYATIRSQVYLVRVSVVATPTAHFAIVPPASLPLTGTTIRSVFTPASPCNNFPAPSLSPSLSYLWSIKKNGAVLDSTVLHGEGVDTNKKDLVLREGGEQPPPITDHAYHPTSTPPHNWLGVQRTWQLFFRIAPRPFERPRTYAHTPPFTPTQCWRRARSISFNVQLKG